MKPVPPGKQLGAFTLTELVVVVLMIALLFGLLLPILFQAKQKSQRIACVNNLKHVGLGFRIFATAKGHLFPMQAITNGSSVQGQPADLLSRSVFAYFQTLSNELSTPRILICPADNRKEALGFSSLRNDTISYFLGVDADDTALQSLLAGDRNLTTNGVAAGPGVVEITTNMALGWTKDLHRFRGNVALGDGSVQQVSKARWQDFIPMSGLATNRVIIP